MKRITYIILAAVLAFAMTAMTACSGGSLTADASNEKLITVTADKAGTDQEVTIGSLSAEEGDTITASAELEEGTLKIELYAVPEDQSADELPDYGDPVFTAILGDQDSMSGTFKAGDYMARIVPEEKTTGTAQIAVTPAE